MNDRGPINRERFIALLDAYGAEPSRWPEAERAGAQALLASDPELQRLHARALELDQLLDAGVALEPSPALRRTVAEIPLRAERAVAPAALPWLFASALRSALAAAFVLGLGVLAGTSSSADALLSGTASGTVQSDATGDDASATAATAEASVSGLDDPLDSLFELAFNTRTNDEEQAP